MFTLMSDRVGARACSQLLALHTSWCQQPCPAAVCSFLPASKTSRTEWMKCVERRTQCVPSLPRCTSLAPFLAWHTVLPLSSLFACMLVRS